ncbi:MAG: tRNA 2-thiouridine(34) synthase MnmA [Oscillospiraceae bacterium]|nr:tRNA 2-thiouridine(34) synthase MnmA [Oscillospiraceae bacterium]
MKISNISNISEKEKAIIAMSGGVDSSVAALLMLQSDYECVGATMQLFHNEDAGIPREKSCCSLDDVTDAKLISSKLGILHYVFNFSDQFRESVMKRFADCYQKGITPNPCIDCNRFLKFDAMLRRMHEMEFDYIVTGHYARTEYDSDSRRYLLKKGLDESKDQSYVLYSLTQEQLKHIRFPLGNYHKSEIRAIAEKNGFVNAHKKDSQDICFVPDGDYAGFLERFTGMTFPAGDFIDPQGNILGQHRGIIHYTIGQRKGLGISAKTPLYVCEIRTDSNQVVIGQNQDLFSDSLIAGDVNLISVESLKEPLRVCAKIRYRHPEQPATAWQDEEGFLHVTFDQPQRAITKGQAVVLYQNDTVVGGGTIL